MSLNRKSPTKVKASRNKKYINKSRRSWLSQVLLGPQGLAGHSLGSCRDPIPWWHQVSGSEDHRLLSLARPEHISLFNKFSGQPQPHTTKSLETTKFVPSGIPGNLHLACISVTVRKDHCSLSFSDELFSFPQKVEEHQGRKKPSKVPRYINSLVRSMTKVLLCAEQ